MSHGNTLDSPSAIPLSAAILSRTLARPPKIPLAMTISQFIEPLPSTSLHSNDRPP